MGVSGAHKKDSSSFLSLKGKSALKLALPQGVGTMIGTSEKKKAADASYYGQYYGMRRSCQYSRLGKVSTTGASKGNNPAPLSCIGG